MKTVKTNSKEFNEKYFAYILESISFEDFDPKNDKEKMELFWIEFDRVANHAYNRKKFPNTQDRISDYLMGLPFHFKFENYEILEFAIELGSLSPDATEKQKDRVLENYWRLTAFKIIQLSKKLGIDVSLFN